MLPPVEPSIQLVRDRYARAEALRKAGAPGYRPLDREANTGSSEEARSGTELRSTSRSQRSARVEDGHQVITETRVEVIEAVPANGQGPIRAHPHFLEAQAKRAYSRVAKQD